MIFLDKVSRLAQEVPASPEESVALEAMDKAQRIANDLQEKFESAMNDDFNTSTALSVIFEAVHMGNECIADEAISAAEKTHTAGAIKNFILRFGDILNLSFRPVKVDEKEIAEVEKLVAQREEARKKKDYAKADELRDELMKKGVVVEDTPEGPVWRKS